MRITSTVLAVVLLASAAVVGGVGVEADAMAGDPGEVSTLRGHGSVAETLDDAADVRRARKNETLWASGYFVPGDTLVVRIQSEEVDESFAAVDGANVTDRFLRMNAATGTNVTVQAVTGPERKAYHLSLARSDAHVVRDAANATFYVVVDTGSAAFAWNDSDDLLPVELHDHHPFRATVETQENGTERIIEREFEFIEPDASVESGSDGFVDRGVAVIDPNATTLELSGVTNFVHGTDLTVRAVGPNGSVLAADRVETTWPPDLDHPSWFEASLTGLPTTGNIFRVQVADGNETLYEQRVLRGSQPRWSNLSAERVGTAGNESLRISATLDLPDDGLFVVGNGAGETVVTAVSTGRSNVTVTFENPPTTPDWAEITVAWDADDDEAYESSDPVFGTSADVAGERAELSTFLPISSNVTTPAGEEAATATSSTAAATLAVEPSTQTGTPRALSGTNAPSTVASALPSTEQGDTRGSPTTVATPDATAGVGSGFGVGATSVAVGATLLGWSRRHR